MNNNGNTECLLCVSIFGRAKVYDSEIKRDNTEVNEIVPDKLYFTQNKIIVSNYSQNKSLTYMVLRLVLCSNS